MTRPDPPMTSTDPSPPDDTASFRGNLVRVMAVQLGALLVLWLMQARYNG